MQHLYCFEAINQSVNDICDAEKGTLFECILIILGGDFA
jgi:hypothetical protein